MVAVRLRFFEQLLSCQPACGPESSGVCCPPVAAQCHCCPCQSPPTTLVSCELESHLVISHLLSPWLYMQNVITILLSLSFFSLPLSLSICLSISVFLSAGGQAVPPEPSSSSSSSCPPPPGQSNNANDVMVNFDPDPADLALSSVPGQEAFDPRRHRFTDDELKPQPMIKKARKMLVPDEQKVHLLQSICAP